MVVLLLMAWRVWRLEKAVGDARRMAVDLVHEEAIFRTSADAQRASWSEFVALNTKVAALASALGYEWKRTDAKEGWERRIGPFSLADMDAYRRAVSAYVSPAPPLERRKADRRKPVGGKVTLVHGDEPCGFCGQRVPAKKKKPRRAH